MAKKNVQKIISIFAAVTIAASQFMLVPSVSAVDMNGGVDFEPESIKLGDVKTAAYESIAKTIILPSTLKGNFRICFDMTVAGRLGDWDAGGKNGNSSLLLTFNTGSRVSGFLRLSDYTAPEAAAEGEEQKQGTYKLSWTDSGVTDLKTPIEIGKKYSYELAFTNVGTGASAAVIVKDADGNEILNKTGLSCRNFSDTSNNAVKNGDGFTQGVLELKAFEEDVETGVSFENVRVISQSPSTIKITVDKAVIEDNFVPIDRPKPTAAPGSSDEPAVPTTAPTPTAEPTPVPSPTAAPVKLTTVKNLELKNADKDNPMMKLYVPIEGTTYTLSADTRIGLTYKLKEPIEDVTVEGNKIIVGLNAPYGETEVTLITAIEGHDDVYGETTFKIVKEEATSSDIVDSTLNGIIISTVDEDGKTYNNSGVIGDVSSGSTLTVKDSVKLTQSNEYVDVKWEVFEKDDDGNWVSTDILDTNTGKFTFKEGFKGRIKLLANVTSKTDSSVAGVKTFFVNISNADTQIELDLDELKAYMEDYEEVKSSFKLPTEGTYASKISWTSSNPSIISTKGSVSRQNSDKTVTLTAILENGTETRREEFEVLVEHKKTSSNSGGGGGSSSSSSRNTGGDSYGFYTPVTTTVVNPIQQPVASPTPNKTNQYQDLENVNTNAINFTDLGGVEWAMEAINKLAEKGIINGKAANTFAPNDNITRAEFAKILVSALNLTDPNATAAGLSDVKEGEWYYSSVASAFTKGVIKGRDDGQFGVNDSISRQDMAVLLYRAAQAANYTLPVLEEEVNFADSAQIDDYAKEAVTALQRAKIINGVSATEFAPKATATRATAAKMIYGIYNLQ